MTVQMTLNKFNSLTLKEKLEKFGKDIFTTKQYNLINALIESDCYGVKFVKVCNLLQVSKASLSSVIGSLKSFSGVVYIHKTFNSNVFKDCRLSFKKLDSILYTHFIDLYTDAYMKASEKTLVEATEKTLVEATETSPKNIIEKAECVAADNDQSLSKLYKTFNSAVIGFTEDQSSRIILIYSFQTLINLLMKSLECDEFEAVEYFDYNLINEDVFINYT